jgi:hypothetical protein
MPLTHGIDSFGCNDTFYIRSDTLKAFFDGKAAILHAFQQNPEMQKKPYKFEYLGNNQASFPATIPLDNPILCAVAGSGLTQFGLELAKENSWYAYAEQLDVICTNDKEQYASSYALIDAACYLVHLLNIYTPNRALIQNLISTHVQVDALGRENYIAVEAAINKVIRKSTRREFPSEASDLLTIAQHDANRNSVKTSALPGIDFERLCAESLAANNFGVQITPSVGDFGADIIAEKDGLRYSIQCKDTVKPVGVKAVQEVVAARSHYKTDYAVVCASAGFTDAAVELATSNAVLLCNFDQLVRRLDAV